jgi:hypothetical protein
MLVESPPRGPKGTLYQIYTQSKLRQGITDEEAPESQFKVFEVTAREAVSAGLISQEFLDGEKQRLGSLYRMYYEASFVSAIYAAFDVLSLEQCELEGQKIGLTASTQYTPKAMGIDPGFGSSQFALTVIENLPAINNKTRVIYSQSFERATYEYMKSMALSLIRRYEIDAVYVDAANPEFIRSLKIMLPENPRYEEIVKQAQSKGRKLETLMRIIPVNFRTDDKLMLQRCKALIESNAIVIHPTFNDLLNDLRVAQEINGGLDKTGGNTLDLIDSFRLACRFLQPTSE